MTARARGARSGRTTGPARPGATRGPAAASSTEGRAAPAAHGTGEAT